MCWIVNIIRNALILEPAYNKKFYVSSEKRKAGNSSTGNQRVIKISIDLVGYKESLEE